MDTHQNMSDADFARLRGIVYDNTGITIGENRRTMMVSRLRRRLRDLNLPDYKTYISHLSKDPDEMQEFTNRVTTNETYFYRTPRVWDHFTQEFLPRFKANVAGRPLRVWSAASSTGEEAYTAGVFLEEERLSSPGFDYFVLGTDISSRVLEIATEGLYIGRPVQRFRTEQPDLFARHMRGDEDAGWSADPNIRSRIRFRHHNLVKPMANTGRFDVVFLRNVLIYFADSDQQTILSHVRNLLQPDGVLYIGESESLKRIDVDFEQVAPIIYRPLGRAGDLGA